MGDGTATDSYILDFEACRIPAGQFHHADHIYLAWLYLKELPLNEVLNRYPESIRRFAAHVGANDLYHETITFAYLFLINERLQKSEKDQSWEDFKCDNEDLFADGLAAIRKYYSEGRLFSDVAKKAFVLPDLQPQL